MISHVVREILAGAAGFAAAVFDGYRCWRLVRRDTEKESGTLRAQSGGSPLFSGVITGLLVAVLAGGLPALTEGDRFFNAHQAIAIIWAVIGGCFISLLSGVRTLQPRWVWTLIWELASAILVVAAGVRFGVVSIGAQHAVELGAWSVPLTVLWIVAATNAVKLLDGLEGAATLLLLVAGVAVYYSSRGASEYFLSVFSLVVSGAALGALRFHFYPARLPLRGWGTTLAGFLFAVLTVLARQKTVAALLLIFPLIVVVILVGGVMLTFLERTMSAGDDAK